MATATANATPLRVQSEFRNPDGTPMTIDAIALLVLLKLHGETEQGVRDYLEALEQRNRDIAQNNRKLNILRKAASDNGVPLGADWENNKKGVKIEDPEFSTNGKFWSKAQVEAEIEKIQADNQSLTTQSQTEMTKMRSQMEKMNLAVETANAIITKYFSVHPKIIGSLGR